jgi:hypothetical protein
MSDITDKLTEFAAILDEFTAAQRRAALDQAKRQRISLVRAISQTCQCTFEMNVDEGTSSEEIFALLAPIDTALDRLKAKADLSDHYNRCLNETNQIEMSVRKLATDRIGFEEENARHSQNRRQAIGLTSQQTAQLEESRRAIRIGFERVDEIRKAAGEARRILEGEDPFKLLDEQIRNRLDALRGLRPTEAAD